MSLQDLVQINAYYTRSINLERDAHSCETVKAYIPTSRALQTLERIANTLDTEAMPRAWALTGPYGSGKSLFAVFLSHLLGNPDAEITQLAQSNLQQANPELSQSYQVVTQATQGCCTILLTGTPSPLGQQIIQALARGAEEYWKKRSGANHKIVKKLQQAATAKTYNIPNILALVAELQEKLSEIGCPSLLIVVDELGKFLEYEARHAHVNDIYLLQALAEQAYKAHATPVHLLVLLHQAFEHYAKGLGERLKNEWQKVQGRFESIAFLESSEQTIRVVQKALSYKLDFADYPNLQQSVQSSTETLIQAQALPSSLNQNDAAQLFLHCYPLHPITLFMLPTLCQRIAQNERTLFSYLGSREPYGFKHSLNQLNIETTDWIMPWQLYEYFILNQPASLTEPLTQRRWAEVITAVERLGDAPLAQVQLLKTIGLFNIIGSQGNFKASPEIIQLCEPDPDTLKALVEKSIITYRKFNNEYRVWQGSDFDLENAVQEESTQLGHISLAEELNKAELLQPLVARRHTFNTGTLRYFIPLFADNQTSKQLNKTNNTPRIILFIVETEEDKDIFNRLLKSAKNLDIYALLSKGEQLREITTEVLALRRIQETQKTLHDDAVAQHEHKIRLNAAEQILKAIIKDTVRQPQTLQWYWKTEPITISNAAVFQAQLSLVMDEIFDKSPIIKNELINRNKPSVSAATGRNRLFAAMLEHPHEADLGIQKYPPEKAIYRSLLKATGLHQVIDGVWQFVDLPENDPCKLRNVWNKIKDFFSECETEPKSLTLLFPRLEEPPYGLTRGVSLVFLVTGLIIYQDELALYEEGNFVPTLTIDVIERLRADLQRFKVQYFKLEGMRASLFREYVKLLSQTDINSKPDVLSIARPITKFMKKLPDYTRQTKNLTTEAQAVREAFYRAQSPNELLFNALPKACGYAELRLDEQDPNKLEGFSKTLVKVLRELNLAHEKLLHSLQQQIKTAFDDTEQPLSALRNCVMGRYKGLEDYTTDREGLKAFIKTLTDSNGDEKQWVERLGSFLAKAPTERWDDDAIYNVGYKLVEFSKRLTDLEQLRIFHKQEKYSQDPEFEATLLRSVRKGKNEQHTIAYVDKNIKQSVEKTLEEITGLLDKLNKEQHKAVIAELVNQLLEQTEKEESQHD